jgi:putative ubiquitin-RnfH superfamily antitoxin RatB of RatAB toxin-antitoxin module
LDVEVVYCPRPGQCDQVVLALEAPATVTSALQASGLLERHNLVLGELRVGIWGRVQGPDTPLRARDRVEVYRALQVDPKEARRLRYKSQKERAPR